MGKKLIVKDADFSANGLIVNLLMKIKAGQSFTYNGETYSGGQNGTYYEFDEVPTSFGSNTTQNYLQELMISKPNIELSRQYCMNQASLEKIKFGSSVYFEATSYNMFKGCSSLTQVLGTPNLSYSQRLNGCFSGCTSLKNINLSAWRTSTIRYFSQMFLGCSKLESIDISSFSSQSAETFESMFSGCEKLNSLILGENFNLNIQNANINGMFYNCNVLETITAPGCLAAEYNVADTPMYALVSAITNSGYTSSRENIPVTITCKNGGILTGTYVHSGAGAGWTWTVS